MPYWLDLAVDSLSGFTAAVCAAPLILTVDRAVTEKAAGKSPLGEALLRGLTGLLTNPLKVVRGVPFWMVAGVYGSTYLTANSLSSLCERLLDPESERTPWLQGAVKLAGTTAVNMSAGVAKDAAFARMFGANAGSGAKPPPVPTTSLAMFAGRDVLTIGAAFTLPPLVAEALVASGRVDAKRAPEVAQLATPIAMQAILTPIHLLALDLYNAPGATAGERAASVGVMAPGATLARMGRFGAAYGVGGVLNAKLTSAGREWAAARCSEAPAMAVVFANEAPMRRLPSSG